MKIAQLHNYYKEGGGEDTVVDFEHDLLVRHGHTVARYFVTNDSINTISDKIRAALGTHYNPASRDKFATWLAAERPDVLHCHNFFPLLSPAVYDAARAANVPIIQTMHNYRTMCAGALLMRNNQICEKCVNASPLWGVVHRCYRKSAVGSLAAARMISGYREHRNKVDRLLLLTKFEKAKFIESGFDPARLTIKPNSIVDAGRPPDVARFGGLFVGRISSEKGIDTLVKSWADLDYPLRIAGDGVLKDALEGQSHRNITFLGRISRDQVRAEMRRAAFLIVPSTWYEGFPMVLVEAFSNGLPVIAARIGSLGEIVTHGDTGLHHAPGDGDDLMRQVRWAIDHPRDVAVLGANARNAYERLYTPEANYANLMRIYAEAIAHRKSRAAVAVLA